jgi:hypothetical protein
MKPTQTCLNKLAEAYGAANMSNLVDDFQLRCYYLDTRFRQAWADALFCIFCAGLSTAMSPGSKFNSNYNKGHLEGAGAPDLTPAPLVEPMIGGFTTSA